MTDPTDASASPASTTRRIGLYIDQWGKPLRQLYDEFALADDLGFDHAWLSDHVFATNTPLLESWTLLAALAERTRRVQLGVLVTNNLLRHPTLLLKQAVTVDHISDGRVVLGVGAGWAREELLAYGFSFPSPNERVARLEESVTLMKRLMREPSVTFSGRYYRTRDASLDPPPLRRSGIPIVIAAHRPGTLRVAARLADQWDTYPTTVGASTEGVTLSLSGQMEFLDAECRTAGRDPASIRRSTWITPDALESPDAFRRAAEDQLARGFTDLSALMPAVVDSTVLERIAVGVLPELRAS